MKNSLLLALASCLVLTACSPGPADTPSKPAKAESKKLPPMPGAVPFEREAPQVPDADALRKSLKETEAAREKEKAAAARDKGAAKPASAASDASAPSKD